MQYELSNNGDFIIRINQVINTRNATEPIVFNSSGKPIEFREVENQILKHHIGGILTSSGLHFLDENEIFDLVELLSSFVSGHLKRKVDYIVEYPSGYPCGFKANISEHNKVISLLIQVSDEKYYLDKYTARIISSKIRYYLSKTTPQDFR